MHHSRSRRADARYRARFRRVASRAEGLALRVILVAALLLLAGQLALTQPDLRWHLSPVERWEGLPLEPVAPGAWGRPAGGVAAVADPLARDEGPWITITLWNRLRAPRAVVLVNGAEVAAFTRREAVVAVREGDILEVDGLAVRQPLVFRVTAAHPEVSDPPVGMEFATRQSIAYLGRVRLRAVGPE